MRSVSPPTAEASVPTASGWSLTPCRRARAEIQPGTSTGPSRSMRSTDHLARRGRGGTRAEPRTQARGGGGGAENGRLQECAATLVHEGLLWALDYTLRMQGPPREAEGAAAGEKPDGVHPRTHQQHGGGEGERRRERVHDGGPAELPRDGGHPP